MKRFSWYFGLIMMMIVSCTGRKIPDVSAIKVDLQLQRFDQDFFAIDTNHIDQSLQQLHNKYPGFLRDFIFNILALPPHPDSSKAVEQQVLSFVRSYKPLKDSADKIFENPTDLEKQVKKGLQFVKYYFPS